MFESRLIGIEALPLKLGAVKGARLEGVPFPVLVARQVFKNKDGSHGGRPSSGLAFFAQAWRRAIQ
jgi:hypothetical protein